MFEPANDSVRPEPTELQQTIDDDSEDKWSTTCNKGSHVSIRDAMLEDADAAPERPQRPLNAYENFQLHRTRSQITRSKRNVYENADIAPLIRRHSEILPKCDVEHSTDSGPDEKSALLIDEFPVEPPLMPERTQTDSSDLPATARNAQRRLAQYENIALSSGTQRPDDVSVPSDLETLGEQLSRHLTLDRKSKQRLGLTENETSDDVFTSHEAIKTDDSDGSYITDSDFDTDEDEGFIVADDNRSVASVDSVSSEYSSASPSSQVKQDAHARIKQIVKELLSTERAYVDRLHFLCRVVILNLKILNRVQVIHNLPSTVLADMFPHVEEIYSMHSGHVMPRLLGALDLCEKPSLGAAFGEIVPHLRLYISYVEKYNKARQLYETWLTKNSVLGSLITEVQRTPECSRLTVRQHMLDVVHRVPKYQAVLKEYVERLVEGSEDRGPACAALEALTGLVSELERAMGKDERMKKLAEIEQRLDIPVTSPTREFLQEGKLKTIAPISGRLISRHVFLFNDLVVICMPPTIGSSCRVKFTVPIESMQVYDGDNLSVPHTFYVQGKRKAFEFCAKTAVIKKDWVKAFERAVELCTRWKLSAKPLDSKTLTSLQGDLDLLGRRIPTLVSASQVTSCPLCRAHLGRVRRKHHCRACGQVVCAGCSIQKAQLEYDNMRWARVCDECYVVLRNRELDVEDTNDLHDKVTGTTPCLLSGELPVSHDGGSTWRQRLISLHSNGFLYCFKTKQTSTPWSWLALARFSVTYVTKSDLPNRCNCFKLMNMRRNYFFQTTDASSCEKWINAMADFADSSV